MKKKAIILTIITIIAIGIITLGVCWRNKNVKENSNLISCGNHIDEDQNMLCDNCGVDLSKSGMLVKKSLTQNINEKQKVEIEGNMPAQSELTIKEVDENKSQEIAQKIYKDSKVIASYEIGINNKNQKYQPEKQGEKVIVKISGLELEEDKTYVILHMEDNNKKYEKINIKKIGKDTVEFKARSFSTYILVEINEYFVTFEGNGNFKVKTNAGVEVESGEQLLISDFSNFTVEPEDGYVVYGEIELIDKNGKITILDKKVSNLTATYTIPTIEGSSRVKIRTTFAPKITEQPKITKAVPGEPVSFTVKSQYTQRYQWQYKEPGINIWKNIEGTKIGIVESNEKQSKLIITNVTKANTAFEYRCLLINNGCNTEETAVKTNPVMAIYTTTSELDVKYTGEVLEDITGKILISGDLEYGATLIVDTSEIKPTDCNLTYKWYSNSIASTENGTQIKTGTNTYQITKAEIGKYIYVEVVATKDGYNERTIKAITYDTVGKMIIQKPKVSGEYIYTGTEQTVQLENYNTATMTASNITRINSGKQVVTVSLKDSSIYSWEDQTTEDIKLEWEIKKLDRTLTIEELGELKPGNTKTVTYRYDGENADVYVKNDNETVISVTNTSTTNGGTLTIVGKEIGKANITINVKETTNYGDVNASIECQVVKAQADTAAYMITEWTIPSANTTIKLPVQGTGLNVTVDWGDGSAEQTVTTAFPTHTYATAGTYEIKVWGTCPEWGYSSKWSISTSSNYYTYTQYLTKVKQFGELGAQQYGFAQCKNLTEVSGDNLVTSKTFENVTYMSYMFYNCSNLTSLDVSRFDTSKVTNMSGMFSYCSNLTSLDVSGFDTSNVTTMSWMFGNCSNLTSLDVSGFDTSKVTTMSSMFCNCSNLTSLDVSGFDTSKVTTMAAMFRDCSNLTSLDVSKFNTSKVTEMGGMFQNCSGLTSLDVSKFNTSNVTDMPSMFDGCSSLTNLDVSKFNTSNVTNMLNMFYSCSGLTSLDVSGFDTSKVTTMTHMFGNCSNLTSLDVSGFDTSKVTNMSYMFYNCSNLTSLDVSEFDTSKVTNMQKMFLNCSKLKSLQLSNKFKIPTSSISNMFTNTPTLKSIIIVDSEPLASQFTSVKDQLAGKTIYVPNKIAEATYETAWASDFTADKIKPILELVGDENVTIKTGDNYTDAGYTVAGFNKANSGDYTVYGYNVTTSGEVNTAVGGKYKIEYILTRTYDNAGVAQTDTLMSVERTVTVEVNEKAKMITEWNVSGDAGLTIKLPVEGTGLNITVDWGDGSAEQTVTTSFPTHTYATAGIYEIKVWGRCPNWGYASEWSISTSSNYYTYTQYLTKVKQFGELSATQYGFAKCKNLTEVSGENLVTSKTFENVTDMSCMFYYCSKLTSLDVSKFNTSKVTDMSYMFYYCSNLTSLDVSGFDTSKVIYMGYMFEGCYELTNLDVNKFNTSKVTNMVRMFSGCRKLTKLDVSNFNTSKVTNMISMFSSCSQLTNLDVSGFDTSNVTSMYDMFGKCSGLTSLDVNNFNTLKVTDMSNMFSNCIRLTNLNLNNFDTSNVTDMSYMFSSCEGLTNLSISSFNTSKVKDMESMFSNCSSLTTLDASSFDTSNVTNMYCMFSECSKLTSLNVNKFSTSKVRNMYHMFYNCKKLTSLNVSNFNTSSVTNMEGMFGNCSSLTSLNVSNFNTSSVTTMKSMFENCSKLTNLDVSNFDTSKVTNMFSMFVYCGRLTTLDLSKFNTSNVTDMTNMFYGCSNLTSLNVSNFDTSKVTSMDVMFYNCSKLTSLDVSNFDTSKITSMHDMFNRCGGLKSLQLSSKFKIFTGSSSGIFNNTTSLNSLILVDSEPLASQFTPVVSQLTGKTIYVPSKSAETAYEESWSGDFTADRIQPILELVGKENITLNVGETYTDAGYTVAGFDKTNSGDYTVYGYNVTTSGEVNTAVVGKYTIEYILTRTYNNGTEIVTEEVMRETRTIEVINTASQMITEWTIPANTTIKLPVQGTGLNVRVDWGDGSGAETITTAFPTHTYTTAGTYEIKVWGTCPEWGNCSELTVSTTSFYYTYTQYLTKVKQFGELEATRYGFLRCINLTEVTGATVNSTSKVTSMRDMFAFCSNLQNVDFTNFNTSNVTSLIQMFWGCQKLISIDLSDFDTRKVTDMSGVFGECYSLQEINLSSFDTSEVTSMRAMFQRCYVLKNIDIQKFDVRKVQIFDHMFYDCRAVEELDVSGFVTTSAISMKQMFTKCAKIKQLNISNFDTKNVTNMQWMFRECKLLETIDLSNFNTEKVTDMAQMFYSCTSIKEINIDNFDTQNVTDMSWMFGSCSKLTSLNLSGFDTSNVTTMSGMFSNCSNLTSLDLSGFDTSKVTMMLSMFYNCSNLTSLDLSGFNTSNVTNTSYMFYNCSNLTSLDVSGFDTSKATDMSYMFDSCSNLKSLQHSNKFKIPTSNNTNIFANTTSLNSLILVDNEPLASQFTPVKSQLTGKTIYVPNKSAEAAYEESWSGDFSGDRIQPILELVGDENVTIKAGETYTDAGYTVAGFDKTNSGDYTVYGYNVTTSGEVNTAVAGKYTIEYILTRTHNNGTGTVTEEIMKATRTVEVVDTAAYMITEWTIPSVNTTIKLPVQGTGLNITVDWGDGTEVETVTTAFPTHTYTAAGTYEIKVWGTCPRWGYASSSTVSTTSNYYTYTQCLTKVKQLGELSAVQYGFAQCKNLTEVSGDNLVTSKTFENVTDMSGMFYNCEGLINLDLSNFDTSKVTSMSRMFDGCSSLTNLDVSGFDTSKVTSMYQMFYVCSSLTNLDLSGFNTSKVTNMGDMFYHCSSLTNLDVSNFDTSNVTYMGLMFANCSSLTNLDVSRFETSKVTNMGVMFYNCEGLTNLDVSGFNTSKVTEMGLMFAGCSSLTNLDVSNFDTSNVTYMESMFRNCSKLTNLDVSRFNTSQVTNMISMFDGCSSLTNLDVSGFDTSKVTEMSLMFAGCSSLTNLDVSGFDTSKVTSMNGMFAGCSSLTNIDVSSFNTSNVTEMMSIFYDCTNLKSLQLSNKFKIPTSNISNMFTNTPTIKSIIIVDSEPLASQFTPVVSQLDGKTIYVPNKSAEAAYEEAWSGDFSGDRIKPILELLGKENITLNVGETYTDAGYTVAGFDKTNSGDYTVYGYNVTTSGDVNTAVAGKYTIEYILTRTYNNGTETVTEEVMRETRTVDVVDTASYMITEWNVSGDVGLTITLPVSGAGLNITVDWGDGTTKETITTEFPTHTYAIAGVYEISVLGNCPVWGYLNAGKISNENYNTYMKYLTKVKQFGELNAKQYGFTYCENLTEVKGATTKTTQNLERLEYMFNSCTSLTSVDLTNFKTESIESFRGMFLGCKVLANLNISDVRTNSAKYMDRMFESCESLSSIDLSNFITDNVSIMSRMFVKCKNISTLDLSSFNTGNVEKMSAMFDSCTELNEIKFGNNFNTNKVTAMNNMFSGCRKLTILDLTSFDTSNVTNMRNMFNSCVALKNLNVTNFDTSKVTDFSSMFYNMLNIETLDISNFDTRSGDTLNMFVHASKLKSIQIGENFVVPEATTEVFQNCGSLTAIITTSETPVENQFKGMLPSTATLYVPNGSEDAYKTTLSGDTVEDKIKPLLGLVGNDEENVNVGETYTDAGYTVAGFTKADSGAYTCYGYSVSSSGEVNTAVAGKYKITYKVTRTYEKDGQTITTQPYEVTREITVMALPLTKPTLIGTYTYNGLIQTAQLKTVNESRFEITNNTRKDAGTQEITVSIKDKNTYAWEDGTTDDIKITWEIKPIIAEITWSATTIEYDGTEKTVTATVSNAVNGEVITVTEYEGTTTAVNVGEYTAKVKSLSSTNYTLEGAVNTEKKWYIQVTVIDMQVIMKDYSYGGTLPTPSITNNSAGRKVTYYYSENDTNQGGTDWSTVKDSLALPVGTYYMYAIVEANQNYQETLTDPVSFKVLGTELKVSVTKENKIEYDGNWVNQNVYIYITVEGNANVTAYQYKIGANGSWIDQVTSPVILQNNMNGEVIVRGVNPAGKAVTSEKSAGLIKIDKTAPSITNVSYKNENKELSITATINDNLSGITAYAITAENGIREWIESTQGTKQAIVDGSGTYTIWAKDEAGNIGHETIDVVKDIHAPVGTIIVKDAYTVENNIYYTNQMNVILQITATDDISTSNQIKMAIYKEDDYNALTSEDEIVWEQYEENKQWTLTKENADEKIYLILKDMAGNISVKVGE